MRFSKVIGRMAELNLKHQDMAKALGICKATFSLKINGRREFTRSEIQTMMLLLNITDPVPYFFA